MHSLTLLKILLSHKWVTLSIALFTTQSWTITSVSGSSKQNHHTLYTLQLCLHDHQSPPRNFHQFLNSFFFLAGRKFLIFHPWLVPFSC